MDKCYLFISGLILAMVCNSAEVQAQMEAIPFLSDTFCVTIDRPLLLMKGHTVTVGCDSAYLINKRRYHLYQRLHRNIIQWNPSCDTVIHTYEQSLKASEQAYRQLLEQYRQGDKAAQTLIDSSQATVRQLNRNLQYTEGALQSAHHDLEETKKMLQQAKRYAFLQKVGIGLSGLGVGLLAGLVLGLY